MTSGRERNDLLPIHINLVIAADVVCGLSGVFQVDGVLARRRQRSGWGFSKAFAEMAHTSELSSPPERRNPRGASASGALPRGHQFVVDVLADGIQVVSADRLPPWPGRDSRFKRFPFQ